MPLRYKTDEAGFNYIDSSEICKCLYFRSYITIINYHGKLTKSIKFHCLKNMVDLELVDKNRVPLKCKKCNLHNQNKITQYGGIKTK